MPHLFHIPVMGTCFTTDSPLRVAHLGIDSAISLVDDKLIERIGLDYAQKSKMPYTKVPSSKEHARSARIQLYLDLVNVLVQKNFTRVLREPFSGDSEKDLYFKLLPTQDPLRLRYEKMLKLPKGDARLSEEKSFSDT